MLSLQPRFSIKSFLENSVNYSGTFGHRIVLVLVIGGRDYIIPQKARTIAGI